MFIWGERERARGKSEKKDKTESKIKGPSSSSSCSEEGVDGRRPGRKPTTARIFRRMKKDTRALHAHRGLRFCLSASRSRERALESLPPKGARAGAREGERRRRLKTWKRLGGLHSWRRRRPGEGKKNKVQAFGFRRLSLEVLFLTRTYLLGTGELAPRTKRARASAFSRKEEAGVKERAASWSCFRKS